MRCFFYYSTLKHACLCVSMLQFPDRELDVGCLEVLMTSAD